MKKDTLAEVMDVEVIKIGSSNQSFFYLFPIKKASCDALIYYIDA